MAIYESEITGFLKKLKQEKPHLEAEQKKGRALLWDKQLDFGLQKEVETKSLIHELLEFIDDVVDELGSREHINYIHTILNEGTGADKQLKVFEETHDLTKVVDMITSEFTRGL